jgi:alkanesulfonate monooxygenase SsuD/methylene tetrahydromethanopterin reductase-like flavin-dependent oxidoreductase (luciferase family)
MASPKLLMILTENQPMLDGRDMRGMVELARVAEDVGFDAVMVSEQTMLGPDAAINGLMENPRMYAAIGNQDPMTPWPSSIATLAAVAAATERVRVVAGAIIPPLRHPLLLAKDLATIDLLCEGRLVVQPTVSWQRAEYIAHGIPFAERGRILDEHLAAMSVLWADSPASFHGTYFSFDDVYSEPKAWRPEGPRMWFGGERMHPALVLRMARYGHGFHPFGPPTSQDRAMLGDGMAAVGRSIDELELVGGTRATFAGADDVADVAASMADLGEQIEAGYTTFCMKPSQYTDDLAEVPALCSRMMDIAARFDID